jgi:glucose/arabinose dehydrogenase
LPPHSAPLGLDFYTGEQFPEQFHGDMFVGIHGSWDRSSPRGYKVIRVRFVDNEPDKSDPGLLVEDFATGWLLPDGTHWGRPVDPLVGADGALYVTDDAAMSVYRIYYDGRRTMDDGNYTIVHRPSSIVLCGTELAPGMGVPSL